MYRLILLLLAVGTLCSGCFTYPLAETHAQAALTIPEVGEERVVHVGEPVQQQRMISLVQGVHLANEVSAGDGWLLKKFTIKPGFLSECMTLDGRVYYCTARMAVHTGLFGTKLRTGGLAVSLRDPDDIKFHLDGQVIILRPHPKPVLKKAAGQDTSVPVAVAEYVYHGRSEDTLKFRYVSSATQYPLECSLVDGNVIRLGALRVRVVEATPQTLRYILLPED